MLNQKYFKSADVYDQQHHWTWRVTLASYPTRSMGPMVRAVLGKNQRKGPRLSYEATIAENGMVYAGLMHDNDLISIAHPLGDVIALRDEFRRLADHCRLNDTERLELFDLLKKWMGKDLRPKENRATL